MQWTKGRIIVCGIAVVGVVAVVAMLTGNAEVFFNFLSELVSGGAQ